MKCRHLTGRNQRPENGSQANALVGKHVAYLLNADIDPRPGRTRAERLGVVKAADGRRIVIGTQVYQIRDIAELVTVPVTSGVARHSR